MNNKLIGLITSLAAVFCAPASAGAGCPAELLAINNSNYIILTKMPPMMPDEDSLTVQFSGRGKLYDYESSGSMSLSRCDLLEKQVVPASPDRCMRVYFLVKYYIMLYL
ncbi:hypothetical protein HV127_20620 [Klebsiella sp. RHBSTW-00215]|uniref:hypothetical protein n=1 Tax=Klebsiella sp. RHBSTW-00215 TaxID=2742640 RepID=UPI0015F3CB71|nr:hypothetical protein [Klebsiella sp. RHBSTW-00215]MBA7933623.1 hypothetical protein [Klebsiella sp. RHBSTW-00215]